MDVLTRGGFTAEARRRRGEAQTSHTKARRHEGGQRRPLVFAGLLLGLLLNTLAIAPGCTVLPKAQRGGGSNVNLSGGTNAAPIISLTQGENPGAASKQDIHRDVTREWEMPQPPAFPTLEPVTNAATGAIAYVPVTPDPAAYSSMPAKYRERTIEDIGTTLGAAQKDTARELGVKLAAMKPVQLLGMVLVLAALSMFWGPIKAVTQSGTLQVITGVTGLLLIVLPTVITSVSPVIWSILAVAGIAIPALWYLSHRHGQLRGFIDANRNGIDDRTEGRRTQTIHPSNSNATR